MSVSSQTDRKQEWGAGEEVGELDELGFFQTEKLFFRYSSSVYFITFASTHGRNYTLTKKQG